MEWMRDVGGYPDPDVKNPAFDVDVWVDALRAALGDAYEIIESEHFLAISGLPSKEGDLLVAAMDRSYERLVKHLPGIVRPRKRPKYVAILFNTDAGYYRYYAAFDPREEGERAGSGGAFIERGIGHFLVKPSTIGQQELTVLHELAHAFVSHLPIPHWLDEGFASNAETLGGGGRFLSTDKAEKHRDHWNDKTIQQFWSGESFGELETNGISYSLAAMLTEQLARRYDSFRRFMNAASWSDAGEAAALDIYGCSLGDFVARVLGPGEWSPQPIPVESKEHSPERPTP